MEESNQYYKKLEKLKLKRQIEEKDRYQDIQDRRQDILDVNRSRKHIECINGMVKAVNDGYIIDNKPESQQDKSMYIHLI